MADLKETIVDGLKIRRPASAADEAVRKGELDAALTGKANQADVTQLIDDATHPPVTTPANQTLALAVSGQQALTGEVRLPAETILQAAAAGLYQDFQHPVANGSALDLGKSLVSNLTVSRISAGGGVLGSGIEGHDYTLNARTGIVTILGEELDTAVTEFIRVTFDCAQVLNGPALQRTADGLAVKLGTTHETAARGDHTHANDHTPASGSVGQVVNVSVDADQKISADVTIAPAGGLLKDAAGLAVDPNAVATKNHTHATVTADAEGMMTPAQKAQLESLASQTGVTVGSTDTVSLERNADGKVTASVQEGYGLTSDSEGLRVNPAEIAAKNHSHNVTTGVKSVEVTGLGQGYTAATINFTGGGGAGATAHAIIVAGEIAQIVVDTPGYGYTTEPTVGIVGDGTLASADAVLEAGSGFASPAMVTDLQSHKTRLDNHDAQLALKADKAYVDSQDAALQTAIDGKVNTVHAHEIADVNGLQTELDTIDGKADTDHSHAVATPANDGFMSADMADAFGCIAKLHNRKQEALAILPALRLESPHLPGAPANACPLQLAGDEITVGGKAGTTYAVKVRVRGKTEICEYVGGINPPATPFLNVGGTKTDVSPGSLFNDWYIQVSAPAQRYNLNVAHAPEAPPESEGVYALDYEFEIQATSGATVQLKTDSANGAQNPDSTIVISGVPPDPVAYDGQFVQVDPVEVLNYCVLQELFGNETTIPSTGGTYPRHEPGTEQEDPPVTLVEEIERIELIDGGEADGDVTEILVNGNSLWVGGKFKRWGNVPSCGLAKLDSAGQYDPFFLIGGGFNRPIDFLATSGSGVIAAGRLDSLCQGSTVAKPLWKISAEGVVDTAFVPPLMLNEMDGVARGDDVVLGVAQLASGKVAVLTPNVLTLLSATGLVDTQRVGTGQFNSLLGTGEKVYLSSLTYSDAEVEQQYDGQANPKGLRLINFDDDPANPQAKGDVDAVWGLWTNAGTGANSACGKIIADPNGKYVIAGNALTGFNSPNTAWNAQNKGNLLLYSQAFDNAAWLKVGALTVTADSAAAPDATTTADTVADTDGTQLAYLYQDIATEAGMRYVFSLHVKKDADQIRFPLFRLEFLGGTATNDTFTYLNTQSGAWAIGGTMGPDVADTSLEVVDLGTYWRVRFKATNAKAATSLRVYLYPAYSNVWGAPAVSLTGSVILWGAQVRKDAWYDDYVATTDAPLIPANTGSNADRFRGLYKILANGKADPTWACNLTLDGEGYAIPFAIDALGRVYFGGPVIAIDGQSVMPWRLYRLTKDGAFDMDYRHFTDRVLVARITSLGQLAVGGKFTDYGAVKCGRFILLNLDGSLAYNVNLGGGTPANVPLIASDLEPDVTANPALKDYLWLDLSGDPHQVKVYFEAEHRWVDCCYGRASTNKLPSVVYSPLSGAGPLQVTLAVPGFPSAVIRFTRGASPADPDATSPFYTGPLAVAGAETIKAYATFAGFEDSDVSSATYQDAGAAACPVVSFDPPSGTLTPVSVTLATALAGATIKYSLDNGSTWLTYATPLELTETTAIQAYAQKAAYANGLTTSAIYLNNLATSRIVNVQFRAPSTTPKTGAAAVGHSVADQWNAVHPSDLALSNLVDTGGSVTDWDLQVQAPSGGQYRMENEPSQADSLLGNAQVLGTAASSGAPLAYWKLDANPFVDEGASHLNITNTHTEIVAGKIGNCARFQAPSSQLSLAHNAALSLVDTDFTIRFWCKRSTPFMGNIPIVMKQGAGGGWGVYFDDTVIAFKYRDAAGVLSVNTWGYEALGAWNHVAVTFHQATGKSAIYINGVLKLERTQTIAVGASNDAPLTIGPSIAAGDYNWVGTGLWILIDEIGLWNGAWTQAEVTADYNGGGGTSFNAAPTRQDWTVRLLTMEPGAYDIYGYGSNLSIYAEPYGATAAKLATDTYADAPLLEGTQYNLWRNIQLQTGDALRVDVKHPEGELHGLQLVANTLSSLKVPPPVFSPANGAATEFEVLPGAGVEAPYTLYASVNGAAYAPVVGPIALTPGSPVVVEAYCEKVGYLASNHVTTTFNELLPQVAPSVYGVTSGALDNQFYSLGAQQSDGSWGYAAPGPHLCGIGFAPPYQDVWHMDTGIEIVGKEDITGTVTGAPYGSSIAQYSNYHVFSFTDNARFKLTFKFTRPGYKEAYTSAIFEVRRIVT